VVHTTGSQIGSGLASASYHYLSYLPTARISQGHHANNNSNDVTIPLQQSASNTFCISSSLSSLTNATGEKEKDRHVSPAPLGTADSNVTPSLNLGVRLSSAKAVKRGAAPGGGAGEKRKKALKRL